MNKPNLIEALREQLHTQHDRVVAALSGAKEAATGDDTKAENKYDTRGLEASYLAAGQAEQVEELSRGLEAFEAFAFPDFDFDDAIGAGALVEVEREDTVQHYLLSPAGGGLIIESDEGPVTVLGPGSPLRERLIGQTSGKMLDDGLMILEVF